ncbi:MAG: hypothetical protein IJT44_11000 [Clostridia bacterium]|nr:hypothetical protein [Clostridia bacterium]
MRKYLKPALEIEAFDVEDLILTASADPLNPVVNPGDSEGFAGAPIDAIDLN